MRGCVAVAGSAAWFVVAPGSVAGVVPWLVTGWRRPEAPMLVPDIAGVVLVLGGTLVLLQTFGSFAWHGRGTPAPPAPTERLVVRGAYRHVRNPMYLAVFAVVLGQALLFVSVALLGYLGALVVVTGLFVHGHEEPTLRRRYGDGYARYVAAVPRWRPRLRPAADLGDRAPDPEWPGPG